MIHVTNIRKKHIFSRMKTMKQHFVLFHNAFHSLSGFAWNHESKKFEADDSVWDERIKANPKIGKVIQNWDKLYELWGNDRAIREHACGLKEKAKQLKRRRTMSADGPTDCKMDSNDCDGNQESSNEDHYPSQFGSEPITPEFACSEQSGGSSKVNQKRKASLLSVMEAGYKTVAVSIGKLSIALVNTGEKVASSKYDANLNSQIYSALETLGLSDMCRLQCYCYLSERPAKAALLVGAPTSVRSQLLQNIMAKSGG